MRTDLESIASRFRFEGAFVQAKTLSSGHINESYVVLNAHGHTKRRYLLQRINHHVFRDPRALMTNFQAVTAHLRMKITASGGDPDRQTITLVPTIDGSSYLNTPSGEYWRAALFVEGTSTCGRTSRLEQVHEIGRAFGQFLCWLSDFPPYQLHETITDFHHTPRRHAALVEAVTRDRVNRAILAQPEIAFVEGRVVEISRLTDLLEAGQLPLRVTHNDTKFDNVLLDQQTGRGICVIDLDTVMPGLVHYDFGDMVRSAASASAEDERDLSRVAFDLQAFSSLTAGYLAETRTLLTPREVDHLAFSARLLTLECGMRFLTDYLDGDRYFRVQHPEQNLYRCRSQFRIVRDMERQFEQMLRIVDQHSLAENEPPLGG